MFATDSQTRTDLQVLPAGKSTLSISSLFKGVASYGGRDLLDVMFRHPLSNKEEISIRMSLICSFGVDGTKKVKVEAEALDFVEYYLSLEKVPASYSLVDGIRKYTANFFKKSNEYYVIQRGIKWLIEIFADLYRFAKSTDITSSDAIKKLSNKIVSIIDDHSLNTLIEQKDKKLSVYEIEKYDHLLRYLKKDQVRELLDIIYQIDVYQAVAAAMVEHKLKFAQIADGKKLNIRGLFYPLISNPVANDINFDENSNIVFLTGANMAGKSTFMRAIGVAVYLAHMGFPVPAQSMEFSVSNGLYTAINVLDDISLGYSHFYSEVQRVKFVAEQMDGSKCYVVLFDELFRGTNVKDAYEATITVIKAFSEVKNNMFVFSSHILEAAVELKKELPDIQFKCFQTKLEDEKLSYSYQIKDGISDDRFGMYIIRREGIGEILRRKTRS